MIDTHCHLLPGIDDGTQDAVEALNLAGRLVDAGVRIVACTPHLSRRFPTEHEVARDRVGVLTTALARVDLPLKLVLAAEVSPAAALEATPTKLGRRRLGGAHLLVELVHDTPAGVVGVIGSRLAEIGLSPVFAHPERCRAVRLHPTLLDEARAAGGLVQVVAPSFAGSSSNEIARSAWRLLESGRVDLLASDAHRPDDVKRLLQARQRIEASFGHGALTELTVTKPAGVLGRVPTGQ